MDNITVIGVGKLGLGFALLLERSGYNVVGVDISQEYVKNLNNKTIKFAEKQYDELLEKSTNFEATTDLKRGLDHSNIIFIIVQTPNGGGKRFYDHTILSNLFEKINQQKPANKHLIIGSTVMPHYIDQIAQQLIPDCENCSINYNPEFVAQGEIIKGFENPDMVLVGTNCKDQLTPHLTDIYNKIVKNTSVIHFMTPLEAEIVKISLNGFITTKISFANMITDLCVEAGANPYIVLNAIGSDTRIGAKYFQPGMSFGGPCFPRDTKALKQLMDQHKIPSLLLEATTQYNEHHIERDAEKLSNKDEHEFTDVCYKPNVHIPIIEESAILKIAEILVKKYKKKVVIKDVPELNAEVKKEYGSLFEYSN
jgi:nucleotide sugar dehydrogenase